MTNPACDPFAEIDARRVAKWKSMLIAEPELLELKGAENRSIIAAWNEIPDVMSIEASRIEWLVEGIIPRASVTLVAGEPGSYKSWLALALLRGALGDANFLGRNCAPSNVLYLDRENPLTVVRERLAILGIESLGIAKIWGGWLPDAPPAAGDARLIQIARERRPLMIFDSLIRFHSADENSATEMAEVMQNLRTLANEGATVVALHHKPKAQGAHYRGSSDIAGGVDTAFSVSRDRQAGVLTLECFKSRFIEEFSITLRPDLGGVGDFVVTAAPEVTAERDDAERLAKAIQANPGQTQGEVVTLAGVPKGRARGLLEHFEGQLWRSEKGSHNAKRFFPVNAPTTVEIEV